MLTFVEERRRAGRLRLSQLYQRGVLIDDFVIVRRAAARGMLIPTDGAP
jgi:hypothetical protein